MGVELERRERELTSITQADVDELFRAFLDPLGVHKAQLLGRGQSRPVRDVLGLAAIAVDGHQVDGAQRHRQHHRQGDREDAGRAAAKVDAERGEPSPARSGEIRLHGLVCAEPTA